VCFKNEADDGKGEAEERSRVTVSALNLFEKGSIDVAFVGVAFSLFPVASEFLCFVSSSLIISLLLTLDFVGHSTCL